MLKQGALRRHLVTLKEINGSGSNKLITSKVFSSQEEAKKTATVELIKDIATCFKYGISGLYYKLIDKITEDND